MGQKDPVVTTLFWGNRSNDIHPAPIPARRRLGSAARGPEDASYITGRVLAVDGGFLGAGLTAA